MFQRLSEHLYLFRDTCNVYVLLDGARALLIDFGDGGVLEHLPELGVTQVDWILHTHHHRDQCQGDALANARGIPIAVPAHERPYFDEVEVFWGSRQIYDAYDVRQSFFTLARSVKVDRALVDYETFTWGPYALLVQPTPGHTLGHSAFICEVDGVRVAFTGDLIAAPGKVHALYDLQYGYGCPDGCDFLLYSAGKLRARGATLACPSHGEPFDNVDAALAELELRLRAYMNHRWQITTTTADLRPRAITPHLLQIPGCSNTWIVMSDSGKALFVDYGCQSGTFMYSGAVYFEAGNRLRMLEHNLDILREQFGMKQVDLALPSHYHDDHVNGLPYLQRHHGARVWCHHNMTDILQNPHGYKLGCVYPQPLRIERSLEQGETFQWEEYEFQVFHAPGHSDYHMVMFGTIDGARVAFTGDEIFKWGDKAVGNNIWRNHVHANSHEITGKLLLERQPEIACPGHGNELRLTEQDYKDYHDWCIGEQRHWRILAAGEQLEHAIYPDYVFLYPYQPPCAPGGSVAMQVWFENVTDKPSTLDWRLTLPDGWTASPDAGTLQATPGEKAIASFTLHIPATQPTTFRRLPFVLDAVIDGKHLGQLAEAVVYLRPEADWARGM